MAYPTPDELIARLRSANSRTVADEILLHGVPFVFRDDPSEFEALKAHLAGRLAVPAAQIFVVGSAQVGYSLAPHKFRAPLTDASDIDVVVVSAERFDQAWHSMIAWGHPIRDPNSPTKPLRNERTWLGRQTWDTFWGWLIPDQIPSAGLRRDAVMKNLWDLKLAWFDAFKTLTGVGRQLARRDVRGRLYRDREHVLLYHAFGLEQLKPAG